MKVLFFSSNSGQLAKMKLTNLPLKESAVLSKSIEFFNDPEPCMIHRGAVMKRLFLEMEDALTKWEYGIRDLPACFLAYVELPLGTDSVKIEA